MSDLLYGSYILVNVAHRTFAASPNSDDQEPVSSATIPVAGSPALTSIHGHTWTITPHQNGEYSIKNNHHDVYARSSISHDSVVTSRTARPELWIIRREKIVGNTVEGYQIVSSKNYCWRLNSRNLGTNVYLTESAVTHDALWILEKADDVSLLALPSRVGPYLSNRIVYAVDHLSNTTKKTNIDVVMIIITEDWQSLEVYIENMMRTLNSEITRLGNRTLQRPSTLIGAVAYIVGNGSWVLQICWMDEWNRIEYLPRKSPSTAYTFDSVLKEALRAHWREDSSRILMIVPMALPDPNSRRQESYEKLMQLVKLVQSQKMLVMLDAHEKIAPHYMNITDFFGMLAYMSRDETAEVRQISLVNYILAATLYKHDVQTLAGKLEGVRPWVYTIPTQVKPKPKDEPIKQGATGDVVHPLQVTVNGEPQTATSNAHLMASGTMQVRASNPVRLQVVTEGPVQLEVKANDAVQLYTEEFSSSLVE